MHSSVQLVKWADKSSLIAPCTQGREESEVLSKLVGLTLARMNGANTADEVVSNVVTRQEPRWALDARKGDIFMR